MVDTCKYCQKDADYRCENCHETICENHSIDTRKGPKCGRDCSRRGGGCFIATAAYGTPFAEEIIYLRMWRDNFLMSFSFGKIFVHFYYENSPPIADYIASKDWLKAIIRSILTPITMLLKIYYHWRT